MLGIIGIHCTAPFVTSTMDRSTLSWWYGSFLQHLVRISLPLFFMLSGALSLNKEYTDILSYYKKRFIRIVLPFLVYSILYLLIECEFKVPSPLSFLRQSFTRIMSGEVSYHLWFVYSIIGLYLCTPFLSRMLQSLNTASLSWLIFLMLAVLGLQLYPPMLGRHIEIQDFVFNGWVIYYILGYYLSQPKIYSRLPMWLFYIGFLLALGCTEIVWWWYPQYSNNMYDLSYTMIMMSCTVFLWFEKKADLITLLPDRLYTMISWIGSYSFSIYLIHAAVLSELVGTRMGVTIYWSNYIVSSTLRILLVFIISLVVSVVIDNLIVKPLQTFLQKIFFT